MGKVSVSIIVPVYKTPVDLLQRFLQSALSQTLSGIQLIAVDDASPDDCPEILDAVAADDDRVSVLHRTTNGRAGMARGDGMDLVKGDYVLFADADDFMQPDMCETLYGLALKYDADIVACAWAIRDQDGNLVGRGYLPDRRYNLTSTCQRAQGYRLLNYALWNKIFRHEAIAPLCFEKFEANIGEDTLFNIAALCRSRTMVTTAYSGYDYFVHVASATGRSSKGMPYLRTLAISGDRIKQTLSAADASAVGRKYADRVTLKRFSTGCGWIADHPDPTERCVMWAYWRRHLHESLLPTIESYSLLAAWYRLVTALGDASIVYRLTQIALRLTDPLALIDKLEARHAFKRRSRTSCATNRLG
jgi:glycosyltransferase involved in cell wall biosynthesis